MHHSSPDEVNRNPGSVVDHPGLHRVSSRPGHYPCLRKMFLKNTMDTLITVAADRVRDCCVYKTIADTVRSYTHDFLFCGTGKKYE